MSERWSITANWEQLETGSREECAGFAALGIFADGTCLTAGHDRLLQSIRQEPYLSAYHLAEWLAWNWWRLRWEPRKQSLDWKLSHAMASIGGGYIWPNLHFLSDGVHITLVSKPTPERVRTPYRYISGSVSILSSTEFENVVDRFIDTVLQRLDTRDVKQSDLKEIWQAVRQERGDPAWFAQRKLEALLGEDPGEMDGGVLQRLLTDAQITGQEALEEIAANRSPGQGIPNVGHLLKVSQEQGILTNAQDRVKLHASTRRSLDPAWKIGTDIARLLREQESLDPSTAIPNWLLASMYGAPKDICDIAAQPNLGLDLSFALSESERDSRIVLRSRREESRRFELARLLGDSLTCATDEPMCPVTRSNTYRQKVQRAFAAELLSPFQAVNDMLDGDYSMENQQDVADHFQVSDWTIRTLLVNHKRIDRGELDEIAD